MTTRSSSGSAFLGSGVTPVVSGLTLVRTRGQLFATLAVSSAAGDGYTGVWGIGKVTAAAFAAGLTAIPTPITEADWDGWLYWSTF